MVTETARAATRVLVLNHCPRRYTRFGFKPMGTYQEQMEMYKEQMEMYKEQMELQTNFKKLCAPALQRPSLCHFTTHPAGITKQRLTSKGNWSKGIWLAKQSGKQPSKNVSASN